MLDIGYILSYSHVKLHTMKHDGKILFVHFCSPLLVQFRNDTPVKNITDSMVVQYNSLQFKIGRWML